MFKSSILAVLFAALAAAAPGQLDERALSCASVTSIVSIMKATKVATPFCSSYLGIKETTVTSTITSTPCPVTSTTTISSTATVTSTSVVTTSSTTTVYPVVAVSVTSTCGLSQTVVMSSSTTTANQKRGATTTSTKCTTTTTYTPSPRCSTYKPAVLGTPTCLTKYPASTLSSACSCLNIPTPSRVVFTTTTLSTSTITSTICSTAQTTTTTTVTTTSVSTYSGTQYYTSTFTVLPPPSSTISATAAPSQTFGAYTGLDFSGMDIDNFFCYPNGPTPPSIYSPTCASFTDCVNECAYYNGQGLGASSNQTCGAVVYSFASDLSSASCYLKTKVYGCGSPDSQHNTGVILPLVAYDPQ